MAAYGTPEYNTLLAEAQRQQNLMNQMNISQGKLYLMELAERQDAAKRQSQQASLAGAMGGTPAANTGGNRGNTGGGTVSHNGGGFASGNGYGPIGPGMVVGRGVTRGGYARPAGTVDANGNVHPLVGFYSNYPIVLNDYSAAEDIVDRYTNGVRNWLDHLQFAPIPQFSLPKGGAGAGTGGTGGTGGQSAQKQPATTDPLLHDGRNRVPETKKKYPLTGEPSWSKPYDSPQLPAKDSATSEPAAPKADAASKADAAPKAEAEAKAKPSSLPRPPSLQDLIEGNLDEVLIPYLMEKYIRPWWQPRQDDKPASLGPIERNKSWGWGDGGPNGR